MRGDWESPVQGTGLYSLLFPYNHSYRKLGLFYKKKLGSGPILQKKLKSDKIDDSSQVSKANEASNNKTQSLHICGI